MSIHLNLGGLDVSDYIMQKTAIVEHPVYHNGPNAGTAKTGVAIRSRLRTSYVFSVPCKPMPQNIYEQIIKKCEANEMSVVYTSARSNTDIGITAQCSVSNFQFAKVENGTRIYYGMTITVEEN